MTGNHDQLMSEHDQLHDDIAELESWWSECREYGIPRFGEMGDRVGELRNHLAEHFAWEEEGGYFGDLLDGVPQFAPRAESLRRQHGRLLEVFDEFAANLHSDEPAFESWTAAHDALADLLERLSKHEHAETALVQEAVQRDIGSKD